MTAQKARTRQAHDLVTAWVKAGMTAQEMLACVGAYSRDTTAGIHLAAHLVTELREHGCIRH